MTRRSNRAEHEKAAPSRSRALTVRAKCSSKTAFIFSKTASMDQNRCVASPGSHELRDHRCRSVTARTRDRITDPTEQQGACSCQGAPMLPEVQRPGPGPAWRTPREHKTRRRPSGGTRVPFSCHRPPVSLSRHKMRREPWLFHLVDKRGPIKSSKHSTCSK